MEKAMLILVFGFIGGIIGYLTNVIAVWMIFHPKKRICIFPNKKLCIQGILPSRKEELAHRIADLSRSYFESSNVVPSYLDKVSVVVKDIVLDQVSASIHGWPLVNRMLPILSNMIEEKLERAIKNAIREAGDRIDIGSIVEEELIGLDTGEIENIFRSIAGKELRFVEYVGFVLGFGIGIIEGILSIYI